jgi:hypothetical protein
MICNGGREIEWVVIASSFSAPPLVDEDDDDAMDTSGPAINGKWVTGVRSVHTAFEMSLVH